VCPFLVHAPSTLLAPGRRCVLRPFGHRRRKGVWLITLPAAEWASKLPRGWTCRDDRRAEAVALRGQEVSWASGSGMTHEYGCSVGSQDVRSGGCPPLGDVCWSCEWPTPCSVAGESQPTIGAVMSAAPAPSPVERTLRRRPTARPERPTPRTAWSSEGVHRVGIVAPDPDSVALLLEYASPLFSAKLITGPELIVRLQPPSTEPGWVIELLALVERWLESVPLPSASLTYGGRSYSSGGYGQVAPRSHGHEKRDDRRRAATSRIPPHYAQTRMRRPPPHVHGKEGVDGSSPSEGLTSRRNSASPRAVRT
jgi:hypothetical protein